MPKLKIPQNECSNCHTIMTEVRSTEIKNGTLVFYRCPECKHIYKRTRKNESKQLSIRENITIHYRSLIKHISTFLYKSTTPVNKPNRHSSKLQTTLPINNR